MGAFKVVFVASERCIDDMCACDDVPVSDNEPEADGRARDRRADLYDEPFPPSVHVDQARFQTTRTAKFTSVVPLAMITPLSPPTFSPN